MSPPGVCPQFDLLWPDLTAREHLQLYARIKGQSPASLRNAVASAASEVGLFPQLDTLAGELSGGQRRKLSVAVALLGSSSVVFLDVCAPICLLILVPLAHQRGPCSIPQGPASVM